MYFSCGKRDASERSPDHRIQMNLFGLRKATQTERRTVTVLPLSEVTLGGGGVARAVTQNANRKAPCS